jgi:hypothetical protein
MIPDTFQLRILWIGVILSVISMPPAAVSSYPVLVPPARVIPFTRPGNEDKPPANAIISIPLLKFSGFPGATHLAGFTYRYESVSATSRIVAEVFTDLMEIVVSLTSTMVNAVQDLSRVHCT